LTLIDIAKRLHLSHTTVSRALNPEKRHLISERTRNKIIDYARQNNFVPNRAARDLVTGKTRAIGVLLPTMFNSLFFNEQLARTLAGIYHVLGHEKSNYSCKLIILPDEHTLMDLDQHALATGVDGLLVSAQYDHFSKEVPYFPKGLMQNWKKPLVFINLVLKKAKHLNMVSFSNFEAARQATTYLIKNGHRRVAIIQAKDALEDSRERYGGYLQALKEHRIPHRAAFNAWGNYTRASGYQAVIDLFKTDQRPTAVFCTNDEMAMGAIEALKSLRIRCPNDVAVMGFDGLETGNYVDPGLTTVRQPSREIAEAGMRLLINLIEEKQKGPVHLEVPSEIIVRDSV
jgi:LacI family transcriptional regulator